MTIRLEMQFLIELRIIDIRVLLLDPLIADEARRREKIEHPLGRKTTA
jgi:hypothetical protein